MIWKYSMWRAKKRALCASPTKRWSLIKPYQIYCSAWRRSFFSHRFRTYTFFLVAVVRIFFGIISHKLQSTPTIYVDAKWRVSSVTTIALHADDVPARLFCEKTTNYARINNHRDSSDVIELSINLKRTQLKKMQLLKLIKVSRQSPSKFSKKKTRQQNA